MPIHTPIENLEEQQKLEKLLEKGEFPTSPIPVSLLKNNNKLIVFNNIHGSLLYGYGRFYGNPVGIKKPKSHIFKKPLELTLYEGLFLLKNGIIEISYVSPSNPDMKFILSSDEFFKYSCEQVSRFKYNYPIYEDLRDKGYIPRPGQKFGADFIAYKEGPGKGHSSFCIRVKSGEQAYISSLDVTTAIRLATNVNKRFLLANPKTKTYYRFKWFKP